MYNIVICRGRSRHGSTPNVGVSHDCPAELEEPAMTQVVPTSRIHGAGTGTGATGTGTGATGTGTGTGATGTGTGATGTGTGATGTGSGATGTGTGATGTGTGATGTGTGTGGVTGEGGNGDTWKQY